MDLSENISSTATIGLGVDVLVATGIRRAAPGLIVDVAGSAALLIALTVGCFGQGASDFTKNIDPLFAGVLAHPGNLGNTIQYAAASANRGDIKSAISAYEQLHAAGDATDAAASDRDGLFRATALKASDREAGQKLLVLALTRRASFHSIRALLPKLIRNGSRVA